MLGKLWRFSIKGAAFTLPILAIIVIASAIIYAQSRNYMIIRKIENGKIYYEKYNFSAQQVIDIADMELWDKAAGDEAVVNTFYYDSKDFRLLLLEEGFAKLNNTANARPTEVEAQTTATNLKKGMWSEISTPSQLPKQQEGGINWFNVIDFAWKGVLILASFGIVGAISKKAYKNFYIQRRVRLLIIGEPSSGKTALLYSMVDPHISKKDLLNTQTSKATTKKKGLKHIPRGKFEIIPEVTDVPGAAFATAWDEMAESQHHVLLIVLSPYKGNGLQADDYVDSLDVANDIDQKYIDIQIGYVQAYVEGGVGSRIAKKPKLVVMFISKFDLFCKTPPYDSASRHVNQKIIEIFKDHINSAQTAAKKAGVPFELVIGSAVEKWGTEQILNLTAKTLYKA